MLFKWRLQWFAIQRTEHILRVKVFKSLTLKVLFPYNLLVFLK
jgi:hypothetical protein